MPYLFPTPAMPGGCRARPAVAVHADAGRFAYDTMTLVGAGHLGGGACRRRLRARPPSTWWPTGAPAGVRAVPPARPPRTRAGFGGSCYLNNAAVAAEALRAAGHARVAVIDVDAHQATAPRRSSTVAADVAVRLGARRPGRRLVPARRRATPTRPGRVRGGRDAEPAARPRAPTTAPGCRRSSSSRTGSRSRRATALVVSLGVDAAARRPREPAAGHRGRLPRGRRRCSAQPGVPAVAVQEGGYHLPTLGGLVAACLAGLAD